MITKTATLKIEGGRRVRCLTTESKDGLPSISIITAVYNGNATIEAAIKSVLSQDYPDFEYIVIDGGSADGTIDTLKKYDEFIDYWASEPDNGVYDALNKGVDHARGEWIYFLGADDRLADDNVLRRFLSNVPASKMVYGSVRWESSGKIYDGEFSRWKLFFHNISQQAIFYHRDLFRAIGKFELKYPILSDWLFNMRAYAEKDTNPFFIDSVVAVYSEKGMSTVRADVMFYRDHPKIIRNTFGFPSYLRFRIYLLFKALVSHLKKAVRME